MPDVIVNTPTAYQQYRGMLEVKHEEEGLCWFWAYPSLMPWPLPVVWLYTPVVGNKQWPGDLWGIDKNGDFLVIECKQCKRRDDPFRDFLAFHSQGRAELSASHWQEKFPRHLRAELAFPEAISKRPANKTDGILPRSNKRSHIRRWPQLAHIIGMGIRAPQYRTLAVNYLQTRAALNDPTPYYLALMIVSDARASVLSERAIASGRALQRMVGPDHVRVITVRATVLVRDQVRITAEQAHFV
ncbi:MAG: hypothetical protein FJ110_14115 [Deltaproteobacteria bacterium]|nr:hypothetical protein [Deltaproteobacteria bacterium]